jgi:hypothetical protein
LQKNPCGYRSADTFGALLDAVQGVGGSEMLVLIRGTLLVRLSVCVLAKSSS